MKIKSLAWMGAGLLLAGVAGAAVIRSRRSGGEMPEESAESGEHAALREILERSAAYNDALYERVKALESIAAPAGRPAAVEKLAEQNKQERAGIDALRAALQNRLAEHGCTFADVDGFVPLISKYRAITLEQQRRHLEVYHRVRKMENMPASAELHAYLKLGYSNEAQKQADTADRLQKAADEQREIMLRTGRILAGINSEAAAASAPEELRALGQRYMEISQTIRLYRDDDPAGAGDSVSALKAMYKALTPPLREQVNRLREHDFFAQPALCEVLSRLLP